MSELAEELGRMRMACRKIEASFRLQGGGALKKAIVMKKPAGRPTRCLRGCRTS